MGALVDDPNVREIGNTPAGTLDQFRAIIDNSIAPSSDTPAYLGEVAAHARHPLGLRRTPSIEALTPVVEFCARRNFAVASRTVADGLELRAEGGPFAAGSGPLVTGPTLAQVMTMAGRVPYLETFGVLACRPFGHASTTPHAIPRRQDENPPRCAPLS
jgi:hypothetical protein